MPTYLQNEVRTAMLTQAGHIRPSPLLLHHLHRERPRPERTHATRTGAATNGTEWGYDTLGQLTSADDTTPAADRAYQYDTIGNRKKTATASLTLPGEDNWSANVLNQLTKANGEDLPADSYDDDGNQLKAKILPLGSSSLASCVYHWDAENRLTSVTTSIGEVLATYTYDAQSRLISRSVGVSPTTSTTYLYDGWNRIAEYQLQNSSFNLHTSYLWGPDLSGGFQGAGGVGGLLSVNRIGSSLAYPAYDGNGNITEYIGADGAVLAHFEYDPFGNTVASTDTTNQFEYRFSTKPQDPATGLLYYGYRWLDPLTGRWPSRDPLGENWEMGEFNELCFISNDSLNWLDVLGLRGGSGGARQVRPVGGGAVSVPTGPRVVQIPGRTYPSRPYFPRPRPSTPNRERPTRPGIIPDNDVPGSSPLVGPQPDSLTREVLREYIDSDGTIWKQIDTDESELAKRIKRLKIPAKSPVPVLQRKCPCCVMVPVRGDAGGDPQHTNYVRSLSANGVSIKLTRAPGCPEAPYLKSVGGDSITYDGILLSIPVTLLEGKTKHYDFPVNKGALLDRRNQFEDQSKVAAYCGFSYIIAVDNRWGAEALQKAIPDMPIFHIPFGGGY